MWLLYLLVLWATVHDKGDVLCQDSYFAKRDISRCVLHISEIFRPDEFADLKNSDKCSFITLAIPDVCAVDFSKNLDLRDYVIFGMLSEDSTHAEAVLWVSFKSADVPLSSIAGHELDSLKRAYYHQPDQNDEEEEPTPKKGRQSEGNSDGKSETPEKTCPASEQSSSSMYDAAVQRSEEDELNSASTVLLRKRYITVAFNKDACDVEFPEMKATLYFSYKAQTCKRPNRVFKVVGHKVNKEQEIMSLFLLQPGQFYKQAQSLIPSSVYRSTRDKKNTLSQDGLKLVRDTAVDGLVLFMGTVPSKLPPTWGHAFNSLFPKTLFAPIVTWPDKNTDESLQRCFTFPDVEQASVFAKLCENISMPLWQSGVPKFELRPRCLPDSSAYKKVLTDPLEGSADLDESYALFTWKEDNENFHNALEPLLRAADENNRKEKKEGLSVSDSFLIIRHMDTQFAEQTRSLMEAIHKADSTVAGSKHSLLQKEIYVHFGIRDRYDTLFELCVSYFNEATRRLQVCGEIAAAHHLTVEVFGPEGDVMRAGIRCALCYYGYPEPLPCDHDEETSTGGDETEPEDGEDEWTNFDFAPSGSSDDEDDGEEDFEEIIDYAFDGYNYDHFLHDSAEEPMEPGTESEVGSEDAENHPTSEDAEKQPTEEQSARFRRAAPSSLMATGDYDNVKLTITSLKSVPVRPPTPPPPTPVSGGPSLASRRRTRYFDNPEGKCLRTYRRDYQGLRLFRKLLDRHAARKKHERKWKEAEDAVEAIRGRKPVSELAATEDLATAVFMILKSNRPMRTITEKYLWRQLSPHGLGTNHFSRRSGNEIAKSFGEVLQKKLVDLLKGEKFTPFTLMVDGSDDVNRERVALFQLRTVVDYFPITFFWNVSRKAGDAGHDYVAVLLETLKSVSEKYDEAGDTPFAKVFSRNLIAVATDGASSMRSTFWSHIPLVRKEFGAAPHPYIGGVWCKAHLLERIIHGVVSQNDDYQFVMNLLKLAHKLFGSAVYGKSGTLMDRFCVGMTGSRCEFQRVFEIRWINSAQQLMENFLLKYNVLLVGMREILRQRRTIKPQAKKEAFLSQSVAVQMEALNHVLSDARTFVRMNAVHNIQLALTSLSLQLQQEDLIESEAQLLMDSIFNKIRFEKSSSSFDSNLVYKEIGDGDTYNNSYGLACRTTVGGKAEVRRCTQVYLNLLFSEASTKYDTEVIMFVTGRQRKLGSKEYFKPLDLVYPNEIVKLRLPNDEKGTIDEEVVKTMKTRSKDAKAGKLLQADVSKFVSSVESTEGKQLRDVSILKLYFSIKWTTHSVFKETMRNLFVTWSEKKLQEAGIADLLFYSVHPEVIVDAAFCTDVLDPVLSATCSWATGSNDMAALRKYPFYMISRNVFNQQKRLTTFDKSLVHLCETFKLPQAADEFKSMLKGLSARREGITEEMIKQSPMLTHWTTDKSLRELSGAVLFSTLLHHQEFFGVTESVAKLIQYTLAVAPTTASVERAFSYMNIFKNSLSTRMSGTLMNARLFVIQNAPPVNLMDMKPVVDFFLNNGSRNAFPVSFKSRSNIMFFVHEDSFKKPSERMVVFNSTSSDLTFTIDNKTIDSWYHRTNAKRNY